MSCHQTHRHSDPTSDTVGSLRSSSVILVPPWLPFSTIVCLDGLLQLTRPFLQVLRLLVPPGRVCQRLHPEFSSLRDTSSNSSLVLCLKLDCLRESSHDSSFLIWKRSCSSDRCFPQVSQAPVVLWLPGIMNSRRMGPSSEPGTLMQKPIVSSIKAAISWARVPCQRSSASKPSCEIEAFACRDLTAGTEWTGSQRRACRCGLGV